MLQDPKSGVLGPVEIGALNTNPVGMKTHIEYPDIFFFESIIVLTTLKWAPTFSSIYYEQVALLHPQNRLASDETKEFLPEHVPHV